MMRAKVAADVTGDQQRMDEVFPNIFIGNKFAAEDAHYLALNNISHVLNMAATVGLLQLLSSSESFVFQDGWDFVSPPRSLLSQYNIDLLNIKVMLRCPPADYN